MALVQMIHVRGWDSRNSSLTVKEHGGMGRVHDSDVSLYLAGGLRPENVGEAVARMRPLGSDVCTCVRTDGAVVPDELTRFAAAAAVST